MARKNATIEATGTGESPAMRRCIGSARFGIEAHEAPPSDFPVQPSQKDGLGRMCKVHWNQYTAGLARDAKAPKAAAEPEPVEPIAPAPDDDERRRAANAMTDARANTARRKKREPADAVAVAEMRGSRSRSSGTTGAGQNPGALSRPAAGAASVARSGAIAPRGRRFAPVGEGRGSAARWWGPIRGDGSCDRRPRLLPQSVGHLSGTAGLPMGRLGEERSRLESP